MVIYLKKAYKEAFTEVNEIIKLMPDKLVNKIPSKFREMIEEERDREYNPNIQEPLEKQRLKNETIIILGLIYRDFLCPQEERKKLQSSKGKNNEFNLQNYKENIEIPLFEERYKIITNVSKIVNEKMNGNFYEFIKNIIDNKKEIKVNSKYEVEIRANMLVVIDLIKKRLEDKVCSIDINDYIWSQGRNKNIELKPYHLTKNTNY